MGFACGFPHFCEVKKVSVFDEKKNVKSTENYMENEAIQNDLHLTSPPILGNCTRTSGRGPARSLTLAFSLSLATTRSSKGTAKLPPPGSDVQGGPHPAPGKEGRP